MKCPTLMYLLTTVRRAIRVAIHGDPGTNPCRAEHTPSSIRSKLFTEKVIRKLT